MKDIPKVSDAELEVMKVLWRKSPLTATEIIEMIKENTEWSPKTIHTLISRLVKKEAVRVDKGNGLHEYSPLISQNELRKVETKSFLQKIYDGSLKLLVSNFIKEEELSKEEIEDLRKILDDKIGR